MFLSLSGSRMVGQMKANVKFSFLYKNLTSVFPSGTSQSSETAEVTEIAIRKSTLCTHQKDSVQTGSTQTKTWDEAQG